MIDDKIDQSECVMLFSSKSSVNSEYVQDEIIEAWTCRKKIYTIQLDDESFSKSFEKRLDENQKIKIKKFEKEFMNTLPKTTKSKGNIGNKFFIGYIACV